MRIGVFVSHSFHDEHHIKDVEKFRKTISSVCDTVAATLEDKYKTPILFDIYFEDVQYGKPLAPEIRSQIKRCDIFVMDIAGASVNTFYELGYAHALGHELVIFEAVQGIAKDIPADIRDLLVGRYSRLKDLWEKFEQRILECAQKHVLNFRRSTKPDLDRCFWFDSSVSEIHVMCAPEPEQTRFAAHHSDDYLYVDNLDDRDALFEVSTFLSRAYPSAKILRHSSSKVSSDVLDGNLVVLGGPHNNAVTRDLATALKVKYSYANDDNAIQLQQDTQSRVLKSAKNPEGLLTKDVGYFGRFLNPFNRSNRLVMCHGCHTFGTLASCLTFADNNQAIDNIRTLKANGAASPFDMERLECIFEVQILESRKIIVPTIDAELTYIE
ncbi:MULTISPECIES: hypothetical protein [Kordiimonas]|jgi:hypothetical protein|uniref:hypothetical protein n=1 Tax=Kordiimonas TaxID=288021 RepID=UPI0025808C5B|nr:hypothetical protein [Kordiimonas sp. UBA4487]